MNYRRAVSVLFAAAAATMLVTASFGFTGVSADRGVSVAVVESENAYVGVSVCEIPSKNSNGNGSNPVKVTVSNQFSAPFTVTLISGDGKSVEPNRNKGEIAPGDSKKFNAFGEEQVTVEVVGGLDASVTVEVDNRCNSGRTKDDTEDGTGTLSGNATSNDTATDTPTPTPDDA